MKVIASCAFSAAMLLLGAVPSFAQGVSQTPPAPNESQGMPQPPNSLPSGARTLPPGTTGIQQMGTVGSTRVQPDAAETTPGTPNPGTPAPR